MKKRVTGYVMTESVSFENYGVSKRKDVEILNEKLSIISSFCNFPYEKECRFDSLCL